MELCWEKWRQETRILRRWRARQPGLFQGDYHCILFFRYYANWTMETYHNIALERSEGMRLSLGILQQAQKQRFNRKSACKRLHRSDLTVLQAGEWWKLWGPSFEVFQTPITSRGCIQKQSAWEVYVIPSSSRPTWKYRHNQTFLTVDCARRWYQESDKGCEGVFPCFCWGWVMPHSCLPHSGSQVDLLHYSYEFIATLRRWTIDQMIWTDPSHFNLGANLSMGDMHFSQGDGEVSFCGAIEMSGFLELK